MSTAFELSLTAHNDRYDEEDPRWLDQVADLKNELHRETAAVRHRRAAVPGTKGAVDQFILTLGTAGVFSVAVDVLRAWLGRDKDRCVQITLTSADGKRQTVEVTAENAGPDAWQAIIETASGLSEDRS